jgi:SAM-dependent methyltransferase
MNKSQQSKNQAWPFNQTAHDYDNEFTNSVLGRIYRNRVWECMDAVFTGNRHILELGCGTGEDALYLANRGHHITAIDASKDMVEQTQLKIEKAGLSNQVDARVLDIENLDHLETLLKKNEENGASFNGVLSNFGVLNCVYDLNSVASTLYRYLLPGSPALFTIMGPVVPWEWAWYLLKGNPNKAFRRLKKDGVSWRSITIWYPSIRKAQAAFSPFFDTNHTIALGTFLPPSYAESWAQSHPAWIQRLEKIEERWVSSPLMTHLADHYVLEMKHTG